MDHGRLTHPSGQSGPTGCPISHGAAAFDPFSDGYQQDPPEYVRWAREQEPVFYSPQLGYWVVTRFDDIKAIFRDNITFSPSIALEKITPTRPRPMPRPTRSNSCCSTPRPGRPSAAIRR